MHIGLLHAQTPPDHTRLCPDQVFLLQGRTGRAENHKAHLALCTLATLQPGTLKVWEASSMLFAPIAPSGAEGDPKHHNQKPSSSFPGALNLPQTTHPVKCDVRPPVQGSPCSRVPSKFPHLYSKMILDLGLYSLGACPTWAAGYSDIQRCPRIALEAVHHVRRGYNPRP